MKARVIVAACACAVMAAPAAPARAAIALRAASTGSTGSGLPLSSVTVAAPAGLQVDDVMLATVGLRVVGDTIAAPSGWTLVTGLNNADTAIRQATYFRVATAADIGASYTFTFSPTATRGAGGIVAYSGVDTAAPIDVAAANTSNGTSSATATAPAVTTTNLRAEVFVTDSWQGGVTVTPDPATTERFTASSTNSTASNNATIEGADAVKSSPGSIGPFSIGSTVSGRWVAQTIALNEMPQLTASFPSAYAWPALVPGSTATSSEQTVSVTSNRAWGVRLASDRTDGLSRQWNGTSYGSLALASPLQWRTSSINGNAQATSFADLSGSAATAVGNQPASAPAVPVGITFRQPVSYADEAALPSGNTYRQNVSYTAQQGF